MAKETKPIVTMLHVIPLAPGDTDKVSVVNVNLQIEWSWEGVGFGSLTVRISSYHDKGRHTWHQNLEGDAECMSKDAVRKILKAMNEYLLRNTIFTDVRLMRPLKKYRQNRAVGVYRRGMSTEGARRVRKASNDLDRVEPADRRPDEVSPGGGSTMAASVADRLTKEEKEELFQIGDQLTEDVKRFES